ncbi:homogentisate 1,2-dioxygenase [Sphingomonas hankookensis]|uniref:homogentisate 1,2-dioxygenase n=1 Tax=Sphingomonas hankookensis TaxID=563996 RepID=UPI003D303572
MPAAISVLTPGVAVRARLVPQATLRLAVKPERSGDAAGHGGIFRFVTTQPGRYRVALGGGAWIDVVDGTHGVASVDHGHGPACSGIRKMVDFDLPAGTHVVQITGSREDSLTMMVARLPR